MKLSGHDGNQASGDVKAKMIRSQTSIFLEHNILIAEFWWITHPEWVTNRSIFHPQWLFGSPDSYSLKFEVWLRFIFTLCEVCLFGPTRVCIIGGSPTVSSSESTNQQSNCYQTRPANEKGCWDDEDDDTIKVPFDVHPVMLPFGMGFN